MTWTDEQETRLKTIEYELSVLYSSISPVEFELRERVWDAWNLIMDARISIEDEIGE